MTELTVRKHTDYRLTKLVEGLMLNKLLSDKLAWLKVPFSDKAKGTEGYLSRKNTVQKI
jgi:hypothetical protein